MLLLFVVEVVWLGNNSCGRAGSAGGGEMAFFTYLR